MNVRTHWILEAQESVRDDTIILVSSLRRGSSISIEQKTRFQQKAVDIRSPSETDPLLDLFFLPIHKEQVQFQPQPAQAVIQQTRMREYASMHNCNRKGEKAAKERDRWPGTAKLQTIKDQRRRVSREIIHRFFWALPRAPFAFVPWIRPRRAIKDFLIN